MAILKAKKIREMSSVEITEKIQELRLEVSKEKASGEVGGTVKNPGRICESRRTIARMLTIQHQKGKNKAGGA